MALNLITILPIMSDPKYIFSLTNLLLTANYIWLQSNIIGALMAIRSWDREGVINIVNRQLKQPTIKKRV